MNLTAATRPMPILRLMRKTYLCLALLALILPVVALASADAGEGTLSVEDGRGKINLQARGGVFGRIDRGTLTVYDTTPADANFPVVTGADEPELFVAGNGVRYRGAGIRFRVVGGGFKLVIQGRGIDLSVVGKGSGFIEGDTLEPGVYSLDGADCRKNRASCDVLPRPGIRFKLGAPERGERHPVMASGAQTVLIVEDEASIASFVSLYLKNAGYDVRAVTTGTAALAQVAAEQPALIILDLMLPDLDGIEICRRVRKTSDVPILMLTARDEDVDKIIGLEVGADDYLTKPFNPRELVARVKSVLRRSAPERRRDVEEELHHGDLSINAGRREVKVGEEEIQLAPKEFDLLWELLDHKGLVLTRDQLLERVWGYTFAGDTRTVDVHVRQLRRKLGEASPIVTVWGVGYKVGPERAPAPAA